MVKPLVHIHTDGAISKPHGPGGWACVMRHRGQTKEFSGIKPVATNSTLELEAVIQALWKLSTPCRVVIHSDSEYVTKAFTEGRLKKWISKGWKKSDGKPVANREQWETLDALCNMHSVTFEWVRGHDGDPMNERTDQLARSASKLARETFAGVFEGQDTPDPFAEVTEEPRVGYKEARERMKT